MPDTEETVSGEQQNVDSMTASDESVVTAWDDKLKEEVLQDYNSVNVNYADEEVMSGQAFSDQEYKDSIVFGMSDTQYESLKSTLENTGLSPFAGKHTIWGAPPRWLDSTDPYRSNYSKSSGKNQYGREYAQNFINDAPLVYVRVGMPQFMPGNVDQSLYSKLVETLVKDGDDNQPSLELDIGTTLRYYGFRNCFTDFANNFEALFRELANKMGLYSTSDSAINFRNGFFRELNSAGIMEGTFMSDKFFPHLNTGNTNVFSKSILQTSMCFYAQEISVSESMQNSTAESKVAGLMKQGGSFMREAEFLFGKSKANSLSEQAYKTYTEQMNQEFSSTFNASGSNMFSKLLGSTKTLFSGGNILFPEIWSDSSYSKNYTLSFKFTSPYGHPDAILRHVYLPAFLWFCLASPRQMGAMGYEAPYLIKAYSKGNFVCDLGMVDSVSFQRGPDCEWTMDSLPTSLIVNVTLKDLYPVLVLTTSLSKGYASNTAIKEFLNTFAGITFSQVDPTVDIKKAAYNTLHNLDVFNNVKTGINDYVTSVLSEIGGILKGGN